MLIFFLVKIAPDFTVPSNTTMTVAILGAQITLLCFDLRSNKIVIEDGNDIDDLKVTIKYRKPNDFAGPDRLKLWKINTDQIISEEMLNDELRELTQKIRETFHGVQGDYVRVAVRAPDTGEL